MKKNFLQNPYVVATLVLVAALAVYFQFRPRSRTGPSTPSQAGAAAAPKTTGEAKTTSTAPADAKKGTAPAAAPVRVEPSHSVDLAYVKQRLGKWLDSPNRDPFGQYPKTTKEITVTRTNVTQILRVSAIWRQTGRRLAVINDLVATEGSDILGYRVERIEASVVKLRGPHGPEQISLAGFDPASRPLATTNVAPAVVAARPAHPPPGG